MTDTVENHIIIILISMIWGFCLALLFRKIYPNNGCVIIDVPLSFIKNNDIIKGKHNNCYKLHYTSC